ncbi:hypothetical protein SLEP1_g33817 [Rubroshorea leprosula]|uniref:Secreted protein n=1 Tax=Rubroshorea leprosula TaxID=152421 RepID=A0AAV5KHU8_9ROSI|nr:hypothetical protein SLEP1_g33817 [Rubroshorea leprosula]
MIASVPDCSVSLALRSSFRFYARLTNFFSFLFLFFLSSSHGCLALPLPPDPLQPDELPSYCHPFSVGNTGLLSSLCHELPVAGWVKFSVILGSEVKDGEKRGE